MSAGHFPTEVEIPASSLDLVLRPVLKIHVWKSQIYMDKVKMKDKRYER